MRKSPITRSQWDKMLSAYRERPTIKAVREAGECGVKLAKRAINEGWPDMDLPPFIELATSGTTVHKEMAILRESWEEAAMTKGEAARQAAEEGMAARITMDAALRGMRMTMGYVSKILEKVEDGEMIIPEKVTPRLVQSLVKSMESSANIVEKAMKIERMRMGEPEAAIGIQIGIMLERCTDEELVLVSETGNIPARILGHKEVVAKLVEQEDGSFANEDDENADEEDAERQTIEVLAADEAEAEGERADTGAETDG